MVIRSPECTLSWKLKESRWIFSVAGDAKLVAHVVADAFAVVVLYHGENTAHHAGAESNKAVVSGASWATSPAAPPSCDRLGRVHRAPSRRIISLE